MPESLPDLLREGADRHADREAVAGTGARLSFAELRRGGG
jgi:non-ribosomal peptide synthetase component E (peptide arylation enzyme)